MQKLKVHGLKERRCIERFFTIFYVTFSGTVSMDDIKNYLLEFGKLTGLPENLLAMYDLRGVNLNLSASDIILISELTDIATASYESVKTAFLVDSPNLTAYTLLFTEELVSGKKKREVFSTEQAALNWLH